MPKTHSQSTNSESLGWAVSMGRFLKLLRYFQCASWLVKDHLQELQQRVGQSVYVTVLVNFGIIGLAQVSQMGLTLRIWI